ncbi:ArsR/SmtB family transcription factor [Streptomyces litchfieldiae]|uniref:Metalloregulator ArsR/SmtB family transcription factor n=1 Tax=Streptomyces litchfieldiae TaxID=3075543 RepID=A0ABU2N042_9ACTN|nr:metalloregulator ArsR/SmtB family transcription factor [Streptomyces sp. DSM 44938]MDT0346888.1 metalloregulator ArsR/SmtB family transcription factor [Streptomyces sp. DSM 44938]
MTDFVELQVYTQLARIGKALASPVRLRLLDVLEAGESDVESLSVASGVGLKNTSAQLQQLRNANLVSTRRQGNHVYYRLSGPEVSACIGALQHCAETRLAELRDAIGDLFGDAEELRPVTVEELRDRLSDPGTIVVDLRSAQEYAQGHVPGAISLPAADLSEALGRIPRDVEVIAYCQGPYCVLSPHAVRTLRGHGIPARPLDGGIARWRRGGGAVETGEEAEPGPA